MLCLGFPSIVPSKSDPNLGASVRKLFSLKSVQTRRTEAPTGIIYLEKCNWGNRRTRIVPSHWDNYRQNFPPERNLAYQQEVKREKLEGRSRKNGKRRREKYRARRENILNLFVSPASHFSLLTLYFSLFYGRKGVENVARGLVSRKTITSTRRLEAWPSRVALEAIGRVPANPAEENRSARKWWCSVK